MPVPRTLEIQNIGTMFFLRLLLAAVITSSWELTTRGTFKITKIIFTTLKRILSLRPNDSTHKNTIVMNNICMYNVHVLVIYTVYSITFKKRLEQWPKMTEVPFKHLFHKYFCIIIVGMQCNKLWLNSVNLYINDIDGRCVHI